MQVRGRLTGTNTADRVNPDLNRVRFNRERYPCYSVFGELTGPRFDPMPSIVIPELYLPQALPSFVSLCCLVAIASFGSLRIGTSKCLPD